MGDQAMCESSETNRRGGIVACTDIQGLLVHFSKIVYKAKDSEPELYNYAAMEKCIALMETDYNLFTISNKNGELSGQYPSQIIILQYEKLSNLINPSLPRLTDTIYESLYDGQKLRDLINKARNARCRARFPVPVILYKGKLICRSATLSGGAEIYGRSGIDYLLYGSDNCDNDESDAEDDTPPTQSDWQLFDRVRSQDIKLLKTFNVGTIIDFMVEKKKVKFGVNVTSSEKVDKENRYGAFKLFSLPYPGCEFFKDFRNNNYVGEGLIFDWNQSFVDATIYVPEDPISSQLHIDWSSYKSWDLVLMTQNYMKLILKHLQENSSGLLIHCISGWDRTPLFVSLLRLSLWADGLAHPSLDAQQILYLTIAYDWLLFGHDLNDRLGKGEEIFFFCFYMLKHLTKDEFSIAPVRHKSLKVDRTTEKTVIRTDSDSQFDGVILEHDPRGSNVSLNSICSSVSSKSQDQSSMWLHSMAEDFSHGYVLENYLKGVPTSWETSSSLMPKSPQARRTSPVTVPASSRLRQRQESSSSLSVGSWQMITGTGSLRGSDTTSDSNGVNQSNDCSSSQDSSHTLIDDDSIVIYLPDGSVNYNRKKRLLKVREVFYASYASTVGLKFKDGGDSSLGMLLGNIAERVGLTTRR